ncbi:MAG: DNA methyltransferase [Planctomycetota bacterium]|nr:DNA methyltransferase [Planctomycetota bacterium]
MFSFSCDTVLDPFCGSGTTLIAALRNGRNGIGVEIDPEYCRMAAKSLEIECGDLFLKTNLLFEETVKGSGDEVQLCEDPKLCGLGKQRKAMV